MRNGVGRRGRRGPAVIAIAVVAIGQFVGLQLASSSVAPPAVVGNPTTFGANNGSNSTAVPTGTAPGDVLVSTIESYPFTTITCPSGWTMAWDKTNGSNVRVAMCVGVVGATVPSTVHIGVNPPTGVSIVTQAFSGVNTSDPIDASGAAASLTPPSVNASAGDLLVFGEGSALWDASAAAPSGATLGATVYAGTSQAAQATEAFPGGGNTPTTPWKLPSKSPAVSGVVALLGSSTSNDPSIDPSNQPQSRSQAITFTSTPPAHPTVGGTYTVAAKGGASGQPVVFSIDGASTFWACSVSGATVSFLEPGTCVIDANQAGTSSYRAAPQAQQSFTIQSAGLRSQTITFTSTPPVQATVGGTYTVAAKGGASGQPVVFSIDGTSTFWACSVSGATVSFLEPGTCVIDANQAGTSSYQAAPQVQQSLAIQAATAATPPVTSGGNCTDPTFTTSNAEGTENTDPNDGEYWWVNNDAWSGSAGPQTLYACNQSSWYATSNQPNEGGQVETYPDTEYDIGGREHPSTTPISGYSAITSTFSEAFPTTGDTIDAAYDIWTDNYTNETMIWNQWNGTNDYWGDCAESSDPNSYCGSTNTTELSVTLDGALYHVLDNGGEIIFFRATQVSSGSVDILGAFDFEIAQGWAKASDVPTQLEYGVEICSTTGTQTFPLNGLTFSLSS
jgi:hypothetical protein